MPLFENPLHDDFAAWVTGFITCGGADYGEILAVADRLKGSTDDAAFAAAWREVADAHVARADAAEQAGHRATARGHLLRAAAYDGIVVHLHFGAPVAPELVEAFDHLQGCFSRAMELLDRPGEAFTYPFDGADLPGWFVPAADSEPGEVRPLVVVTNGYDASVADTYLAIAAATVDRGYHCVLYDGPGQGQALVHQGIAMVADWERVVAPLLDVLVARPDVDPARIAIHGWSLGGYLAARAASAEPRFAACVCDPPLFDMISPMKGLVAMATSPDAADRLPELSAADAATITSLIEGDPGLTWRIIERGYWVNGATDLPSYLQAVAPFTMAGRAGDISCPFLGTTGEGDMLTSGAADFVAQIAGPTTLVPFTAAEGAGGHCEMQDRWLLMTTVMDWLDEVLPAG